MCLFVSRQLLLFWPAANDDLARSFIQLVDLLLSAIDDPMPYIASSSSSSSGSSGSTSNRGDGIIQSMLVLPHTRVSSIQKCVCKVVSSVSSQHAKVSIAALALLRRNNTLHNWILPLPVSAPRGALDAEQRYREDRLGRLVDSLRAQRGQHWQVDVRSTCGLFLDDLLDYLYCS